MPNKKKHADAWLNSPFARLYPDREKVEHASSRMDRGTEKYGSRHREYKEHNVQSSDGRGWFEDHHRTLDMIDSDRKAIKKKFGRFI